MSFERSGATALDYEICRYGVSRLHFRGPKRDLDGPYVAFLGGTETFGRCVPVPFPALVEQATGRTCVNLGQSNAGIDAFIGDPEVPRLLAGARLSVLQVPGATNMSNRFYRVHPRRNDRFLDASPILSSIYPDVDFTEFTFNRHMLQSLKALSDDRFRVVEDELRTAWSARVRLFLRGLSCPSVLLWIRVRTEDPLGADPLLVTREMVEDVSDLVCDVVEVKVVPAGASDDFAGMVVGQTEWPVAGRLIGPSAHAEIAAALNQLVG
ncbi:DUF6473 family protein [Marinibacterium profundimaris]|uniref:DUF6473 domain-containing protein n=1 Tax=Marinibacterium profundimaris TaxID=1679460 RepID=A0A225NFF1_9RHOB|nr:DUF6473 family protein [Marinibacterium profundimaris]OWU71737.1 hypothetical protein ATO3_18230 [Marinibacterium profundimaris]